MGLEQVPAWLQTNWTLGQFGVQRKRAIAKYMDFIRAGIGSPSLWSDLRNQIYLGSEEFVTRMQAHVEPTADLAEVPRAQRRPMAKPLTFYQSHDDARTGMALAYLSGDYSMKAISDSFGVHYSTVSRAVNEYEKNK